MLKLASTIAIFAANVPSTLAFSSNDRARMITTRSSASTAMNYHPSEYDSATYEHPSVFTGLEPQPQTYDRALECANNYGFCNIDELLDLSEELDEYLGCYLENGQEACENEINNRQDLAEALLVQGEMMEHEQYVEEGNVFPPQDANQNNIQVNEEQGNYWESGPSYDNPSYKGLHP